MNATEQIEADIIFGVLRPNQEITEDALIQRFKVKRYAARTIIQELINRRLVVKPRSKSARVKDFSLKEVHEIYFMRELLQGQAARIIPFPVDQDELNKLKEIHIKYVAAATIGADKKLIHDLNDLFHTQLFSLCMNDELNKAITYYTEISNPIRSYGITDKDWLTKAIRHHTEMILAIENHDNDLLEKLVIEHMQPTRKRWENLYKQTNAI